MERGGELPGLSWGTTYLTDWLTVSALLGFKAGYGKWVLSRNLTVLGFFYQKNYETLPVREQENTLHRLKY